MPFKSKEIDAAYRSTDAYKKKAAARTKAWREKNPTGHQNWVAKNEDHRRNYNKNYSMQNRAKRTELHRNWALKNLYGISVEEYDRLLFEQDDLCAICHKKQLPKARGGRLFVDHDHATGKVRGLLCTKCNALLGHADDNEETLLSAVGYLRKSRT